MAGRLESLRTKFNAIVDSRGQVNTTDNSQETGETSAAPALDSQEGLATELSKKYDMDF